jgi:UDP-N-acetylmuramoyl-tripeptide--D-alanyl-D-alanine ligase
MDGNSTSAGEGNPAIGNQDVPTFSPDNLVRWTGGRWTVRPTAALSGFTMDSRQLRSGQVFVALKTDKRDGHDYLAAAQTAGASAAIVERPDSSIALPQLVVHHSLTAFQAIAREHRRNFPGPVVGISGSAGKTSTKNLLALLLGGTDGAVLATEGNLNNHLGVPLTLTKLDPATHKYAVIEAGIGGPGEMVPLAAMIEANIAIITLVAPAHTAELGGLDGVAREKAVLPGAVRPSGVAIFPRQCAEFPAFRELDVSTIVVEPADVLRPAEPPKDKVYYAVSHRGESTAVSLAYGAPPPLTFTFRRVSDGMAQNAALAICAALWLGVSADLIQTRIAGWQPAKLRGEIRHEDGRLLYLDCYNANPASMADALGSFSAIAPAAEPRLLVLGGMEELGVEAENYHRQLGRSLRLRPQDLVCTIGDHAAAVRAGAIEAGARPEQVEIAADVAEIAARFSAWRGAVFVKGSRRYALEKILPNRLEEVHA